MARICMHESVSILIKDGKRIPKDGTKGNVFVYQDFISHEIILSLCAVRIGWKNLNVSVRDIKFASGAFEVDASRLTIKLDKYEPGWYPYTHRGVQEDLIEQKVVLL